MTEILKTSPAILSTDAVIASAKQDLREDANAVVVKENPEFDGKTIAEVAESFDGAVVSGIDDAEGIKAMNDKRLAVWRIKKAINKKETALLEVGKRYALEVKAAASEFRTPFEKIEAKYKARLQEIKDERQRAEEAEERKRLEMIKERTNELFEIGLSFNGEAYEIGGLKITPERIEQLDSVQWLNALSKLRAKAQELQSEADRIKAEAEAAKALQEENARLLAELAELKAKANPAPVVPAPVASKPEDVAVDPAPKPEEPIAPKPEPVKTAPTLETAPELKNETPAPVAPEPQTAKISSSNAYLIDLIGNAAEPQATHFKGGFRKGIQYAKDEVIRLLGDKTITSRAQLKDLISAL